MKNDPKSIAQKCMESAYGGTMSFPEIVNVLIKNGFESYHVDYLRGTMTYYLAEGGDIELAFPQREDFVAREFNAAIVQAAIKEAQQQVAGYSYKSFCKKVTAAGCAGYIVSFPGKRVVYFGRSAEMHVEHFPQ